VFWIKFSGVSGVLTGMQALVEEALVEALVAPMHKALAPASSLPPVKAKKGRRSVNTTPTLFL
jgi:hypothetical protein